MNIKISPSFSRMIQTKTNKAYWGKFEHAVQNLQLTFIDEKTQQLQQLMTKGQSH